MQLQLEVIDGSHVTCHMSEVPFYFSRLGGHNQQISGVLSAARTSVSDVLRQAGRVLTVNGYPTVNNHGTPPRDHPAWYKLNKADWATHNVRSISCSKKTTTSWCRATQAHFQSQYKHVQLWKAKGILEKKTVNFFSSFQLPKYLCVCLM